MNITIHLDESGRSEGFRISPTTTCQDVLNAFQFPDNYHYELTEYWRDCERSIKENERLCDILRQWGPAASEVKFFLKQVSKDAEDSAGGGGANKQMAPATQNYAKAADLSNGDIPKMLANATATLEELKGIQAWQAEQIHLQQSVLRDKQQMLSNLAANSRTTSLNYTDGNRGNNSDSLGRGRPARNSLLTDQRNAAALETPTGSSPLDQASGQLQRLKEEFERSRSYSASEGSGNKVIASQKVQHTSVHNRFTPNDSANISSSSSNENRLGAPLAPTNQHLMTELDSVRAMFSDKEKELSVAVAKVEELTSQLEALRASTQVLPWPNASSSAAVDSSTLYLQNKIGAESGNNLVFDRMNSQLLMRNMMNKEQSMKLEARKSYLTERVTELDNLHAKMKALNDRINLIKDQQQAPQLHSVTPNAEPSESINNTSRVSESNASTIRNQFAPIRRFDSRQDHPPPVAQVSPMRLTPSNPSPTINTPDKSQTFDNSNKFANAFIDINLSNGKIPPSPVPSLKMSSSNGSRGGSTGSPSASPFSNSPAHSPNTYSLKQKYQEDPHQGVRSDFNPEERNQKLAAVRPMQLKNDSSLDRKSPIYSPVQKNLNVPSRDSHQSMVDAKSHYNSEKPKHASVSNTVSNTVRQSPPVSNNYGEIASNNGGPSQVRRELKFPTSEQVFDYSDAYGSDPRNQIKTGSSGVKSNDSKSSGIYTAEDRLSDETLRVDMDLEDSAKNPVIHQYPILQQFVSNQSNENNVPVNEASRKNNPDTTVPVAPSAVPVYYPRPSAYERLFPEPPKFKSTTTVDVVGGFSDTVGSQINRVNEEKMIDGSKSSIHIDKTTGAKQIRRRSSLMNMENKDLVILQNRNPQYFEGEENQMSSFKPPSVPSKKPVVGILKKNRPLNNSSDGRQKRRVTFDKLALFLDAALDGDLALVENLFNQLDNPSDGNDEGITALHNAICAGHASVVDFLVQHGCDVNAADSDGWTPLHCAASCNNVMMVKYLVEHGACIFARTFSDGETPADKCEEQEPNYASCSQYLYGVQEKLGIMNRGVVYALYNFDANNDDELSVIEGDAVMVLRRGDEEEGPEWWFALLGRSSQSEKGYVPRNILGVCCDIVEDF